MLSELSKLPELLEPSQTSQRSQSSQSFCAQHFLIQGGCKWYHCIDDYLMTTLGLTHTFTDHSMYVYATKHSLVLVPLYIDDLLLAYHNEPTMEHLNTTL